MLSSPSSCCVREAPEGAAAWLTAGTAIVDPSTKTATTVKGVGMTKITFKLAVLTALTLPAAAQQLATPPPSRPEPPPVVKPIEPLPAVPDWLSYNYDRERTGWNRGETRLSKRTVGRLKALWNRQLLTNTPALALSTLTAPIVAGGVSTP